MRIGKNLLRQTLNKAYLSYEVMNTIFCDCEAVINSYPLTYLTEDPTQLKSLTTMIFLQKAIQNEVPDLDKLDLDLNK